MASPDISAVVALCNKSFDLDHVGHCARSHEYSRRALAAAEALGAQDCLIMAYLQLEDATQMIDKKVKHDAGHGTAEALPPEAAMVSLFFVAAATLQRRRAAGTLLAGVCRPAEVEWEYRIKKHRAEVRRADEGSAELAPLVGYKLFLSAAEFACLMLVLGHRGNLAVSAGQLRKCVALIADAAELVLQPRIHRELFVGAEAAFADRMRKLMTRPEYVLAHGADGARLLASWRRVEQSGVLQRRGIDDARKANKRVTDAVFSAADAAAAAPGLRSCALASCNAHEQHPNHFKTCAACRKVAYCCKEHQSEHWPAHKAPCKAARKATAAEGADAA
jgi:hypothetical protein